MSNNDFHEMKYMEQRLTTSINNGMVIPLNKELKDTIKTNAEKEIINPRLVKGFGFKITKH